MSKYTELANRLEASCFDKDNFPRMGTERAATANLCAQAATALRELEAKVERALELARRIKKAGQTLYEPQKSPHEKQSSIVGAASMIMDALEGE